MYLSGVCFKWCWSIIIWCLCFLQDDEYLASLQADREKELKAQEEAEAALAEERRKEEELRKQLQEEEVPYVDWHMDETHVASLCLHP